MKWILIYLKSTSTCSLCFANDKPVLDGYTYAYMASDIDFRKSILGYLTTFVGGGAISWQSGL